MSRASRPSSRRGQSLQMWRPRLHVRGNLRYPGLVLMDSGDTFRRRDALDKPVDGVTQRILVPASLAREQTCQSDGGCAGRGRRRRFRVS
jgi:hypothetical protein